MNFLKSSTILKVVTFILSLGLLFAVVGCTENTDDINGETIDVTGITVQSAGDATTITTLGGTLQLSATIAPNDATNKDVLWTVVNGTGSATISQSGLLTALTDGLVTVKVASAETPTLNAELIITISNQVADETIAVTGILIASEDQVETIAVLSGTLQLSFTLTPANATNQNVTWSVENNTGSANIDQAGLLTALTNGTVTVTVTSVGFPTISDTLVVTITNQEVDEVVAVTGITMSSEGSQTAIETQAGTLQLSYLLAPANATNQLVTWTVVNGTGSATIDQAGLLTAVSDGLVTVKVTSDGYTSIFAELDITISNQVSDNSAPLATAIVLAIENKNETEIGENSNDFVVGIYFATSIHHETYLTAIEDAQLILAAVPLTSAEVSNAVTALELATTQFNSEKQEGTKLVQAINLGVANDFVLLSKTGISTTGTTHVVGNLGVSPVSASYITGFGLIMDSGNEFSTSSLVTGQIYAADYLVGTPTYLTTAIADVLIAYNDGVSRTADFTELYTGNLSGQTLQQGVYKWSGDVLINSDLTLNGSATDVFIFQIAGTLSMAANTQIVLTGGLLAENIFFVVADTVTIGVSSSFYGVILAMTNVSMGTGSSITGMIYAQTSISLDATVVTKP